MGQQATCIRDYTSDDIDFVVTSQLRLYKDEYGFDSDVWRNYLTGGVNELVDKFDPEKDCFYILEVDGKPAQAVLP